MNKNLFTVFLVSVLALSLISFSSFIPEVFGADVLVNGGFESGVYDGSWSGTGDVSNSYVHSGSWSGVCLWTAGHFILDFPVDYAVDDIVDFSGWVLTGVENLDVTVEVYYNDTTWETEDFRIDIPDPCYDWYYQDWSVMLDAGKFIDKVEFDTSDAFHVWFDDVVFDVETPGLSITADLENIDEGVGWVFTDWKYYTFNATVTYVDVVSNISMMFVVPTGEERIAVGFWSDGEDWIYSSNMTYESREGEPCVLKAGSWVSGEDYVSVTFDIWFNDRILDVWDSSDCIDVYGNYNADDFFLENGDFFKIYTNGGFEMNFNTTGAAGKLAGGNPFSLYANNGSIAYNEIWYRDGQHIKIMPDIHFLTGLEPFYVRYGVDYSLGDGEWLNGWEIHINPKFVSYTGIFAANVWINMTNIWYGRSAGAVSYEDLYMFYHGSVSGVGDPGHWKSWVDLWFSDKNASTVGSGRYNAYEYPMIDEADLWLRWLANNWGVKDNVLKEMSISVPLLDTNNSTAINSEQIKMMRFWCELEVDDTDNGQYVSIENYEAFDITHSRDLPLTGMSDPVFDETLIPTIGQKGILGALWSMFAGLGQWLSENIFFGGLNLWGTFVNFLDTIAGMFGAPKFFSNLFDWIYEAFGYVYLSLEYVLSIASDIFSLMGVLLAAFLTTMGDIIWAFVNTITMFTDMMGEIVVAGEDMWTTLGISQWITIAIIFYPLYLVILWDQEGMDAVIKQLTMMFGILSWLFDFFVQLIQFTIRLITTIIESIPVAE